MKAVIFDLDGVVVDTAKYHYQAWQLLAKELGFSFASENNERLKGVSRMESLRIVLEAGGMSGLSKSEEEALAERKNRYYLAMIDTLDQREILPGITEFIQKIAKEGYRIALGSASKSGGMILEKTGLLKYFDQVVDGNLVSKAKPDPEVFLTAASLLLVSPGECVVIEDAAAGIKAAKSGGMKCIGIGDPAILAKADLVLPSTKELAGVNLAQL